MTEFNTKQEMIDYIINHFNDFATYSLYWEYESDKYVIKLFKYHPNDTIIRLKLQLKMGFSDALQQYITYTMFREKNIKYLNKTTLNTIILLIKQFKSSLFS